MEKKLPWLKYDMKKLYFVKVQGEEKSFKKKMEEAAKIWQDSKCISQSKGFSSRVARSQSPDLFYSWLGL